MSKHCLLAIIYKDNYATNWQTNLFDFRLQVKWNLLSMELNLNQINKEKDGIIKIISWVYTVQDKV